MGVLKRERDDYYIGMNIVITGAGSAIAQAVARKYAEKGASFWLIDRNEELQNVVAADLSIRGAKHVEAVTGNMEEYSQHRGMLEAADRILGGVDLVLIAHGVLPDQKKGEESWETALESWQINGLSAMSFMTQAANYLATRKAGTLVIISSVAGDRGRQSNYIYGSAKGALAIFAQGLRNRLADQGVRVLTVKPGFVDTPMTRDFKKGWLWVKPEVVAQAIVRGVAKRKEIIYVPWFWRYIMLVIRLIPERIFKRLSL